MHLKYSLIIVISIVLGCNQMDYKRLSPEDYNGFSVMGGAHTYMMSIKIHGNFDCPVTIEVFIDERSFNKIVLSGSVDTIINNDWYQNKLGLKVYPIECIDENDYIDYLLAE